MKIPCFDRCFCLANLALLAGLAAPVARAANDTWTGGGGDNTFTNAANWGGTVPNASGDALFFGGATRLTPSNNTPNVYYSFTGITFNSGAGPFTVMGGQIGLGGGITNNLTTGMPQTIQNALALQTDIAIKLGNAAAVLTNSGVISGNHGITNKLGGGLLVLTASNTFTNFFGLSAGMVSVPAIGNAGAAGPLGACAAGVYTDAPIQLFGNTLKTLQYAGPGETNNRSVYVNQQLTANQYATLDASGTGPLVFNSATNIVMYMANASEGDSPLTLTGSNPNANTLAGDIYETDTGNQALALVKQGVGTWALTGAKHFRGRVDVTGGTLMFDSLANAGTACALGEATLLFNYLTATPGGYAISLTNGAVLELIGTGANTSDRIIGMTGSGTLSAGTNGGTLILTGGITNLNTNNTTLTLDGTSANTISGPVGDSFGSLGITKIGVGIWTLSGTDAHGGATTVSNGTLYVSSALSGAGSITVKDGATLGVTVAGGSQLPPATLTLGRTAGAAMAFTGLNSTTTAPINAGTLVLNGQNTINFNGGNFAASGTTYPLIVCGSISGAGRLTLGTSPTGLVAALVTNGTGPYTIALQITTLGPLTNVASNTVLQRYGANYLALEAEDFYSLSHVGGGSPGFTVVVTNSFTSPLGNPVLPAGLPYPASQGSAIIADPRYGAKPGGHASTASYQLVFSQPGTYYFYYRESLFATNAATNAATYAGNDSFYYSPNFGAAATTVGGSLIKQDGSGAGNPVSNPFEGRYFWYNSGTVYTVTAAQVGQTLVFNIDDDGLGLSLDRLVFSQNPNLQVTEPNGIDGLPNSPFDLSAVYSLGNVPHEETTNEIAAREAYLQGVYNANFSSISNQIAGGQAYTVVTNLVVQAGEADDDPVLRTVVALGTYYFPSLQPMLVTNLEAAGYAALTNAASIIVTNGGGSDLNVTEPTQVALKYAWALNMLGAYFGTSAAQVSYRSTVENFISTYMEGSTNFLNYQGHPVFGNPYLTTGYNKEVTLNDLGATVACIYQGRTNFPLTKATFETFWTNVTITSYDADNSPHYDSGTGFNLILNMGFRLGRANDLIHSPHLKRLMDRMARTVENSGQGAKWGKSMWSWYVSGNTDYLQLNAGDIQWCLKAGYMLWTNPFYLYMARKYEAFYLENPQPYDYTYTLDLWPIGIDQFNVSNAAPQAADTPSQATPRISSSDGAYGGFLLGRGDPNYQIVPDKLILSTGHHPRAPYMLMDLSFSQSKAAIEHRGGITTANYSGAHTVTMIDRCGEANKMNKVFICPTNYSYPIVPVASGDVTPTTNWYNDMGYSNTYAWTAYTNTAWGAGMISSNAAYGTATFAKYEYRGVGVSRQVVLLHNGLMVVSDTISTSSNYAGGHNGGVLWQVLPAAQATQGTNWVLMQNLPKQLPFALPSGEALDSPSLIYFAAMPANATVGMVKDSGYDPDSNFREWFYADGALQPSQTNVYVSLVIPIANLNNYSNLLAGIGTTVTATNQTVWVPYGNRKIQQLSFTNGLTPGYQWVDLDPVVFTVPTNLVVPAGKSNGTPVSFITTAANSANGSLPTVNTPASGSVFPVGATRVTVTATDSGGDTYSTTFTVTVVAAPATPPGFPAQAISVMGGIVSLTATGAPGTAFSLWASTNLALAPITNTWTRLTNGAISTSPFNFNDPEAVTNRQRFYRFSTP